MLRRKIGSYPSSQACRTHETKERHDAKSYRLFPYSECQYSPYLHNPYSDAAFVDLQVTKPPTDWLHMQVAVAPRRPVRASVVVKASKSDNAVSQGPKLALIVPGKNSLIDLTRRLRFSRFTNHKVKLTAFLADSHGSRHVDDEWAVRGQNAW